MKQLELVLEFCKEINGKTKLCPTERSGCGVVKRLSKFHKNGNNRDGLSNICADCINKKHAQQKIEGVEKKEKEKSTTNLAYKFFGINPKAATKATKNVQRKK